MTCPRCEEMKIVDPSFLVEAQKACEQLTVDLIVFCRKHKIDHTDVPALQDLGRVIAIIQSL